MGDAVRVRRGVFPTDSLVTGTASLDVLLETASARVRRAPSIRDEIVRYDVVISGYPRSGNSFLAEVLKSANQCIEVGERQHSPLVAPLASSLAIPIVIPIREPIATISSWVLFKGASWSTSNLKRYFHSYARWHQFVRKYRDSETSVVVSFSEFTAKPSGVLALPLIREVVQPIRMDSSPEEILVRLREKEVTERGSSFANTASVPVADRTQDQEQLRARMGDAQVVEAVGAANEQYELLYAEVDSHP